MFYFDFFVSGGWGWLVCGAAFLAYLLTSGLQFAFGLLYIYTLKYLLRKNDDKEFYVMATGIRNKEMSFVVNVNFFCLYLFI